jgi:hypothetical protein
VRQAAALRAAALRAARSDSLSGVACDPPPPRLIHVTAPRAGNSFLHNQDGLFLLDKEASRRREELGRFETMDEVVESIWREVLLAPEEDRAVYRKCPASPMVKVTAPIAVAIDVLDLLDRDFYNRGRIMPTHDNVVKALQFERTLNTYRRKKGYLAAITFGQKS